MLTAHFLLFIKLGAHVTTLITTLHERVPSDEILIQRYGKVFLNEFKQDHRLLTNSMKFFPGMIYQPRVK
jgi:hypothetical protein